MEENLQELLEINKENLRLILLREKKLKNLEEFSKQLIVDSDKFKSNCQIPWYEKIRYSYVFGGVVVILFFII